MIKMSQKVLTTLFENAIAPRFDLATEVLISSINTDGCIENNRTMVLAHASAEDLCQLISNEGVEVVICNGIEEEFFDYLTWKKVRVLDSVMGPWEHALNLFAQGKLRTGSILYDRKEGKFHG